MLNQPYTDEYTLSDIIDYRLDILLEKLNKEGFVLAKEHIDYNMFDRCESISVESELLYPTEDLPSRFGVNRGYAGGGVHTRLWKTEIDRMTPRRQAKAERVLGYFVEAFQGILKDADEATEEATGEELQEWDSVTI